MPTGKRRGAVTANTLHQSGVPLLRVTQESVDALAGDPLWMSDALFAIDVEDVRLTWSKLPSLPRTEMHQRLHDQLLRSKRRHRVRACSARSLRRTLNFAAAQADCPSASAGSHAPAGKPRKSIRRGHPQIVISKQANRARAASPRSLQLPEKRTSPSTTSRPTSRRKSASTSTQSFCSPPASPSSPKLSIFRSNVSDRGDSPLLLGSARVSSTLRRGSHGPRSRSLSLTSLSLLRQPKTRAHRFRSPRSASSAKQRTSLSSSSGASGSTQSSPVTSPGPITEARTAAAVVAAAAAAAATSAAAAAAAAASRRHSPGTSRSTPPNVSAFGLPLPRRTLRAKSPSSVSSPVAPSTSPRSSLTLSDAAFLHSLKSMSFNCLLHTEQQLMYGVELIFLEQQLLAAHDIHTVVLRRFLNLVRHAYNRKVNYHNFRHAFDVFQAAYSMLTTGGAAKRFHLSRLHVFALLLGALGHDLAHPGTNNAFHVATLSPLALRYNDASPLENHHLAVLFELLTSSSAGTNILGNVSIDTFRSLRALVIPLILGTDMAFHQRHCDAFRDVMARDAHISPDRSVADTTVVLTFLLKCADISNVTRDAAVANAWGGLVAEEFFVQGDREAALGLPVKPMFDRSLSATPSKKAESSHGFIHYVAEGTFKLLVSALPDTQDMLRRLQLNKQMLKRMSQMDS